MVPSPRAYRGRGGPGSSGGGGCGPGSALAPLSGGHRAEQGVSGLAGETWTALDGVVDRMDLPPTVEVLGCLFAGVAAVVRLALLRMRLSVLP